MQLSWKLSLSGEEYVATKAWKKASLGRCLFHPGGGCGFHRNGSYRRKTRWGEARVPCWRCPQAGRSVSRLADCFSARLPGTLDELEAAALAAETEPGLRSAAERARPGHAVSEAANRRWIRRRRGLAAACLVTVITLLPEMFAGCGASVTALRACLGTARLLCELRGHAAPHLQNLPSPLGFGARTDPAPVPDPAGQHMMGPDPPA